MKKTNKNDRKYYHNIGISYTMFMRILFTTILTIFTRIFTNNIYKNSTL
jgi:hypothetical protein